MSDFAKGILQLLEKTLGVEGAGSSDPSRKLSEMGLDSMDQVELVMAVEERWEIDLSDLDMDDYSAMELGKIVQDRLHTGRNGKHFRAV